MKTAAIIGAGISGSTIARVLAENHIECTIFEAKNFLGGLVADVANDFPVNLFGPHIFHTNIFVAYNFIFRFCELNNYIHRVKSMTEIGLLDWPINWNTICKIFKKNKVDEAIELWHNDIRISREKYCLISTFEQKMIYDVGKKVYDIMLKNYSKCQWGKFYDKLPVELFRRVRIIDSFDDRFFDDEIQGIPKNGYSALIRKILNHSNISIIFNTKIEFDNLIDLVKTYGIVISTAPSDEISNYKFGELEYQRIDFQKTLFDEKIFHNKECKNIGVINFARSNSSSTRITNYKRLACNQNKSDIVIADMPGSGTVAYPIRTQENLDLSKKYIQYMKKLGIIQAGRLGLFEYIDMDEAVYRALNLANKTIKG